MEKQYDTGICRVQNPIIQVTKIKIAVPYTGAAILVIKLFPKETKEKHSVILIALSSLTRTSATTFSETM